MPGVAGKRERVDADAEIVFEEADDSKWQRALAKLGVSPSMLSTDAGHA